MGCGLWVFVSNPIEVSQDMVDCASACLAFIKETTAKEMLCKLVPELQECLQKWDSLEDLAKGQVMGYVIGKYGVDIFIGSGSIKAIQLYRNLRKANAAMTFEAAAISPKHTKEVLEQVAKEWKLRETVLKNGNLKIQWDKQGKHIQGHRNYNLTDYKGIFAHEDAQKLVAKFAGKGKKMNSISPGKPGYKELLDFEEFIGFFVEKETGKMIPTTWGSIHYAKDGVHIVPRRPR